ncbi:MAG: hypothetical protein ACK5KO_05090 [Arachnia sp.]
MPTPAHRLCLIIRVAKLYHELHLKQVGVAERLQISRAMVSRHLRRAEELGLVRTVVSVPPGVNTDIEDGLQRRFSPCDAIVIDNPVSPELLLSGRGAATAAYLESTLTGSDRVGFSS